MDEQADLSSPGAEAILNHYENMPIQIYRKFHLQKLKISNKTKPLIFSYFCSKHRLWVLVRTGSNEYPQFMFLSRNMKNNVYPCRLQFHYIKVGFEGGQYYIDMFS